MKKTGTFKNKVFAGVIAAVCAVSVISTGAIIGASAFSSASSNAETAVIERRTSGSTFTLPMKGVDWNYFSDSLDVTVDCEIDFSRNLCNFKFTAIRPGAANITLQTKSTDGTWSNTPIRITVDSDLRMNIVQNGKAAATNNDIKFTVDEDDTTTSSTAAFSVISEKSTAQDNSRVETNDNKDYWLGEYAGTTRNEAINLVVPNYYDGWTLLIADESVYYGADAWYVSVLNENTGAVKSAYVIGDDCYFVEDSEEETEETNINVNNREYWAQEYANTTLVDAVDLAASCIDDGWGYTYSEQTRYNGFAAWAIVFTNSEGEDVVVFVNGTDCYLN